MSNNPGKKGKPAPWVRRAQDERIKALEAYQIAHHPEYAAWSERRSVAAKSFRTETGVDDFSNPNIYKAMKASDALLRAWAKKNPNPMSWEEYKALELEFAAQYVPRDYSRYSWGAAEQHPLSNLRLNRFLHWGGRQRCAGLFFCRCRPRAVHLYTSHALAPSELPLWRTWGWWWTHRDAGPGI